MFEKCCSNKYCDNCKKNRKEELQQKREAAKAKAKANQAKRIEEQKKK